ncbi:hypothetical protein [Burkholderia anthina]|uniref:hypothetical protein n=1 Tax=Burkholderia anthina TaxID=179879 RepID=UPI001AA03F03|nr:hypothetical protein [Burkholderia anthina]QTD88910.1 hypothetical protein J4G50_13945 [Burkholderia anthina]
METIVVLRYIQVGPCHTGLIWFDTETKLYPIFEAGIDPNAPQPKKAEIDYKAGWHSR